MIVDIFWPKTHWVSHQHEPIVCVTFNVTSNPTHYTAPGPKYRAKFMPTPRTDFIIWWKKSSFHGLAIPAQPYVCQPRGITNDQIPNDSRREAQMMRNYLRILTAADSRSYCQWWSDNDNDNFSRNLQILCVCLIATLDLSQWSTFTMKLLLSFDPDIVYIWGPE